jgi:hypothetical protein
MITNMPLGPNVNFNARFTQAFWSNRNIDDFWFYQENGNQWYYFDIAKQEFFLIKGEPRNLGGLKEISLKCFQDVRHWIKERKRQVEQSLPIWPKKEEKEQYVDPWRHERWV